MKANELRIGNWIEHDNRYFQIYTIAPIFPTLDTIEFGIGVVDYNNIKPIPLTEEILLKCGFEKSYYENIPYFEKGCLSIDGCFYDVELMDSTKLELKFLHQLQNLYFALTGSELTIQL